MLKRLLRITLVLLVLSTGACGSDPSSPLASSAVVPDATPDATPDARKNSYLPGEVLLQLRPETVATRAAVVTVADAAPIETETFLAGARVIERMVLGGAQRATRAQAGVVSAADPAVEILRLQLPDGMSVAEGIVQLTARPEVLYAEPNYRIRRARVPDDPDFDQQWGLQNSGQTLPFGDAGTPGADINAPAAWDVSTGNDSIIVATIDTGIEYDHPDLAGNIWRNPGESGDGKEANGLDDDGNGYVDDWQGWNFVGNNNDARDDDVFAADDLRPWGHGTHVAGIIGAVGNNQRGVSGINWNVQLMPLKFFDATGEGDVFNATKAINYAVANGARVINASYEYVGPASTPEYQAIAAAGNAGGGVLFVAAAGNGENSIGGNIDLGDKIFPAAHALNNIITVAATDPSDGIAHFSNFGGTSVDLGAPGVSIYSTVRLRDDSENPGYDYMSGTSMATPMVSGAAALLWGEYPNLTATEVRELLFSTVDTIPALTGLVASGGRLNLGAAMTVEINLPAPAAPEGLTGTVQATGVHLSWDDQSNNEKAFIVERTSSSQPFTEIARLPAGTTTYTDSNSVDGLFSYRIKAVNINASDSNIVEISLPQLPPANDSSSSSGSSSNCFIATAAFGTPFLPQVTTLRTFRDRVLLTNAPGRTFVALYYRSSPPLADFIAEHETLRTGVRILLRPLVWLASVLTPNEAEAMSKRTTSPPPVTEDADIIAGELLVCFRPELTEKALREILQAEQSEELERIISRQGTVLRIKLAAGVTTTAAQKKFSAYQEVVYAEPNRRVNLRKP